MFALDHLAHLVRLAQQRLALQKERAEAVVRARPSIKPSASIVASALESTCATAAARASACVVWRALMCSSSDRETSARPAR